MCWSNSTTVCLTNSTDRDNSCSLLRVKHRSITLSEHEQRSHLLGLGLLFLVLVNEPLPAEKQRASVTNLLFIK